MKEEDQLIEENTRRHDDLKRALEKFTHLFEHEDIFKKNKEYILKAYNFEKPLSSLEFYGANQAEIMEFVSELREFLFVAVRECNFGPGGDQYADNSESFPGYNCEVYVSRFRSLVDVTVKYGRLSDEHADLAGILYGFSTKEVVSYCIKERCKWLIKK